MRILEGLAPEKVMYYFEEISNIPRESKNEKQISDYLVQFAKNRNLSVVQDNKFNVIIYKSGTVGYESAPIVIIQGHTDMVCEKNQDTVHDFKKDPLALRINGDLIKATGTTLGADNGIAVAFALALLDSDDIPHPPLEVLMTADEERGMTGANAVDASLLKGKILINIDTEEEGELYVSCAGGIRGDFVVPIQKEEVNKQYITLSLHIRGLQGGHSGMDIHKGHGNSNKIGARILYDLKQKVDFRIVSISGGAKSNAIPREFDAVLAVNSKDIDKMDEIVKRYDKILKNEYHVSDSQVHVYVNKTEEIAVTCFTKESTSKVIDALELHPNGVQSMSMDISGLVESSLNIGVITTREESVLFESAIRSSVSSLKQSIVSQLFSLAEVLRCQFTAHDDYPAWQYRAHSPLRDLCIKVYKEKYGKEPGIKAIHAGLECGLFAEKLQDVDMISFGPNIRGAHTPEEQVSISSIQRTWEYFIAILKEIK